MTTIELARMVYRMRDAQKVYFRERTQGNLEAAKQEEGNVDRAVKMILDDKPAMLPGMEK